MGFKGIYQHKSSVSKIGLLFLLIFVSVALHNFLFTTFLFYFADNSILLLQYLLGNEDVLERILTQQESVNYLKLMQLFSGVGLFITPILLYAHLTDFDFKFNRITRQNTILVVAIMMLITPFVGLLLEWNMQIHFPSFDMPAWLSPSFDSEEMVKAFLKMNTISDLLYTLIVIAVVPAIGEELLFRGYLQQKICKWLKTPHTAIVIIAFLFSVIHLDPEGIIPRFVLGVLLGYLYYWSGSLWLPILAHFVNNAQAVIFSYSLFKVDSGAYSILSETKIDPMLGLFSFCSVIFLLYVLYQNLNIKKG
ncbi:MAG: CPBP family intramembrane glutamic endopeptidase [Bacteroidota bacterium]|nr:CPBP family intramembrane glutamic endopeptidase [Bacteroidota bacterium]